MSALLPLVGSLLLVIGALFTRRQTEARRARDVAKRWAFIALIPHVVPVLVPASLVAQLSAALPSDSSFVLAPSGHLQVASVLNALLAPAIVLLSPLRTHRPITFARVLGMLAAASAFLAVREPWVLGSLWALSAFLAHRELTELPRAQAAARLFAIYQLPTVLFFGLGAYSLSQGQGVLGTSLLLLAIALRGAIVPAQSWLLEMFRTAPAGVVAAFVAPQLGVYGHLELLQGHLLAETMQIVAIVGAVSAVLAALLGLVQKDIFRAATYLFISQSSLVTFGLENESPVGWTGALLTWLVLTVAVTGLLMALANLRARRGALTFGESGGHPRQLPRLGIATLVLGLATVGCPLTLGFVAEDLLVQGSVGQHPYLGLSLILVTLLNGISVVRIYFSLFTAGPERPGETDIGFTKSAVFTCMLAFLFIGGIFPEFILRWVR